eukprot:4143839-Prymnesium_polylepis.1
MAARVGVLPADGTRHADGARVGDAQMCVCFALFVALDGEDYDAINPYKIHGGAPLHTVSRRQTASSSTGA